MTALSMSAGVAPERTRGRSGAPVRRTTVGRPGRAVSGGPVRGTLHATVRGRRVVLGLIVVVSAGLGLLGGQAVAATPAVPAETVRIVVEPGDTLWELALGLVEPGEDIRDVVLEIQELNGMGSAALSVGDELLLPAA